MRFNWRQYNLTYTVCVPNRDKRLSPLLPQLVSLVSNLSVCLSTALLQLKKLAAVITK